MDSLDREWRKDAKYSIYSMEMPEIETQHELPNKMGKRGAKTCTEAQNRAYQSYYQRTGNIKQYQKNSILFVKYLFR